MSDIKSGAHNMYAERSKLQTDPHGTGKRPILRVEHLCLDILKGKNDIPILQDISFDICEGERWAIAGESGAGKSMTMNVMTSLFPQGSTRIRGRILFRQPDDTWQDLLEIPYRKRHSFVARNVAVIFQDSINALNPNERILKQYKDTVRLHSPSMSDMEIHEHILSRMDIFSIKGGEETLRHFPDQLSGGMRQRIAIAMALESPARILIADEPTTSLDAITQRNTIDFIRDYLDHSGRTLLYISHDMGILQYLCDYIMILKNGRMVEQGTAKEVFYHGKAEYTKELVRETLKIMGKDENNETSV